MSAPAEICRENTPEVLNECAMFAVILLPGKNIEDLPQVIYQGLTEQQGRAEGAAGMYVSNGSKEEIVKDLGTVAVAFQEGRKHPKVKHPKIGLGHTRYPTAGGTNHIANIQPLTIDGYTLAHHGNLTNMATLLPQLRPFPMGGDYPDNDSWIALNAIAQAEGRTLGEKVANAQRKFEGAWDFIVSDGNSLVASRDPHGIRPFSMVRLGPEEDPIGYAFAIEDNAFKKMPKNMQAGEPTDILPGETVQIDTAGLKRIDLAPAEREFFCIFEYIYMSRIDTVHKGKLVSAVRRKIGDLLAKQAKVPNQKMIIMPVPDSGRAAEKVYFKGMRERFGDLVDEDEGIYANRYYGRNFIKSSDQRHAELKFSVLENIVKGQPIVLVDDSLVRGDTMQDLVRMCREAGASEVHVVIASPEIKNPCSWGVAFPSKEELIANRIPDIEERAAALGADTLIYLNLDDLLEAVGDEAREWTCTYCLDGNGPPMSTNGLIPLNEVKRRTS